MEREHIYELIWFLTLCFIPYFLHIYVIYICGLFATVYFVRFLLAKLAADVDITETAVLITGCDSGFGYDIARRLDSVGFTVFAGCLDDNGYGATKLKEISSPALHVIPLDVTSDESVNKALVTVRNNLPQNGLWGVVNNAGINMHGEIEFLTLGLFQKVMDINLYGALRVTKAVLPLIRRSKGRIVNVSSVLGRFVHPRRGAYCVTKHGLETLSDSLRLEMKKFGVNVSLIEPGRFAHATSIHSGVQRDRLLNNIDEMWEEATEEMKETYGKEYLESWIENPTGGWQSRGDTGPVVKATEHALMSAWPKSRYLIGGTAVLIDYSVVLSLLGGKVPSWITDWYLSRRTQCHTFLREQRKI